MRRLAAAAVVLVLASGCLGGDASGGAQGPRGPAGTTTATGTAGGTPPGGGMPAVEPVPAASLVAANLTRRMLTEERVTLEPAAARWAALRLFLADELLTGDETFFAFVSEPVDGASPYLALAVFVPSTDPDIQAPAPVVMPLAQPTATATSLVTVQSNAGGEGGPANSPIGTPELMVLYGTMQGVARVHVGIVDAAQASDLAAAQQEILGRPRIDIAPDHVGEHGFAGTFLRLASTSGERHDLHAGLLQASLSAQADGPAGVAVGQHVVATGEAQLPVDGVAAVMYGEPQAAAAGDWRYDWRLGDRSAADEGSGPMTGLPVPTVVASVAGTATPRTLYQGPVKAGPAHVDIERTFSGKADLAESPPLQAAEYTGGVIVTWGYVGADLTAMYGWPSGAYQA